MKGGADSGFRKVKPEDYTPRLLHFHGGRKGVTVTEVPRNRDLLDNTDVYIMDLGLKLVQWNGSGANKEEKMKVGRRVANIKTFCFKLILPATAALQVYIADTLILFDTWFNKEYGYKKTCYFRVWFSRSGCWLWVVSSLADFHISKIQPCLSDV